MEGIKHEKGYLGLTGPFNHAGQRFCLHARDILKSVLLRLIPCTGFTCLTSDHVFYALVPPTGQVRSDCTLEMLNQQISDFENQ
jgi:hypothetical protein